MMFWRHCPRVSSGVLRRLAASVPTADNGQTAEAGRGPITANRRHAELRKQTSRNDFTVKHQCSHDGDQVDTETQGFSRGTSLHQDTNAALLDCR